MPTYSYKCCGHVFDVQRGMFDETVVECPDPECDEDAVRVFSAPAHVAGVRVPSTVAPRYDPTKSDLYNLAQME